MAVGGATREGPHAAGLREREVLAVFREALAKLRRDAGEHLDDDAVLLNMARQILGGPQDEGRASYQVALNICESCQVAKLVGDGHEVPVGPEVVELVSCDAQHIGPTHDYGVAVQTRTKWCRAPRGFR